MRIKEADLHPRIWAAIARYRSTGWTSAADPRAGHIYLHLQPLWWREHGFRVGAWATLYALLWGGFAFGLSQTGLDAFGLATVLAPLVAVAHGIMGWRRTLHQMSSAELRVLRSVLDLTPVEAAYCDAVLAVAESNAVPDVEKRVILAELRSAMDAADGLLQTQAHLETSVGEAAAVRERLVDLDRRIGSADPETAAILEETRRLTQERLQHAQSLQVHRARIEALLDLARENFAIVAQGFGQSQLPALDSLAAIQGFGPRALAEAQAVGRAIQELNT